MMKPRTQEQIDTELPPPKDEAEDEIAKIAQAEPPLENTAVRIEEVKPKCSF